MTYHRRKTGDHHPQIRQRIQGQGGKSDALRLGKTSQHFRPALGQDQIGLEADDGFEVQREGVAHPG